MVRGPQAAPSEPGLLCGQAQFCWAGGSARRLGTRCWARPLAELETRGHRAPDGSAWTWVGLNSDMLSTKSSASAPHQRPLHSLTTWQRLAPAALHCGVLSQGMLRCCFLADGLPEEAWRRKPALQRGECSRARCRWWVSHPGSDFQLPDLCPLTPVQAQ